MSGPKVSVYELSAAQKKRYYEQLEVLKQTGVCQRKIAANMCRLDERIEKLSGLIREVQDRCASMGKEFSTDDIKNQIEELKKSIKDRQTELDRIKTAYLRDKTGYVNLGDMMCRERESRLQALKELSEQIDADIRLTKDLEEMVLKIMEGLDESVKAELRAQMLGGFAVDFAALKHKAASSAAESAPDDASVQKENEQKRLAYTEKINAAIESVADMIGSLDRFSPELAEKCRQIREKAAEIDSVDFLENFYAITVTPFVKECRVYAEVLAEFDEVYARYAELCDDAGLIPEKYTCTKGNVALIQEKIAALESENAEKSVREFINKALDEAMEEMGYDLVGDREAVKKSGRKIRHELYHFGEGTGVDITYGENGQITMELGGFDDSDRVPSEEEANRLTEDMHRFCGEYAALERILEKKGVQRKNISLMPPSPEFAQIFNTSDYDMTKPVQKFEAKKERKAEQKVRHAE